MNTFPLQILASDRVFYQGECSSLIIPTVDGQYGIMANHANTVIGVSIGHAMFQDGLGKRQEAVLSAGICMIENGTVTVLIETAERPEEIDRLHAEQDAADARRALEHRGNVMDARLAQAKMARALSRLKAKEGITEID